MHVVGLQSDLVWEDAVANRERFRASIDDVAVRAVGGLVVLPEMWPSGFSMHSERVAEPEGGASERFLVEAARQTGAALAGSIAQTRAGWERPRNVFVLATPEGGVQRYAKIHPFAYGGESRHYDAGDVMVTVRVAGVRVTPLICYDLRFAEVFTRRAGETDLFVVVANWPATRAHHWKSLLVSRAIETQAYVLGVNRVGTGGGLVYEGDSLLVSPLGEILSSLPPGEEGVIEGEVDPAVVAEVRASLPFLRDRRPDVYRSL
jgi:predicted amidohydrolase